MAKTRPIRVSDLTLGLHDFPERAKLGHASTALNVEYRYGGASTRRGTLRRSTIVNQEHQVKGFWFYRRENGDSYYLCAYVINDGGVNNREGRLAVLDTSGVLRETLSFTNAAGGVVTFADDGGGRWGGLPWMDVGEDQVVFIIGVSNRPTSVADAILPSLFIVVPSPGGPLDVIINEIRQRHDGTAAVIPFWAGENPDVTHGDDVAAYLLPAEDLATGGPALAVHDNRLVTSVRDITSDWGNRSLVRFSNYGDRRGWPRNGYLLFGVDDPIEISALASYEGRLLVFNRSNMWTVAYKGFFDNDVQHVLKGSGCIAKDTIAQIPKANRNWVVWLAQDGLYGWAGGPEPIYLSDRIEKQLRNLSDDTWSAAHGFYYPLGNQYFLNVPDGDPRVTHLYVWDVLYDAWSRWDFTDATDFPRIQGFAYDTSGRTPPAVVMRIAQRLEFIHLDTNGWQDNFTGTTRAYTSRWKSHPIKFGENQVERFRYIRPTMTMQDDLANRTIFWLRDLQSYQEGVNIQGQSGSVPGSPVLPGGFPATFGNITFGNERLGAARDFSARVDCFGGPSNSLQVGIESTVANRPFQLLSFEVDVMQREVRR